MIDLPDDEVAAILQNDHAATPPNRRSGTKSFAIVPAELRKALDAKVLK